MIHNGGTVKWTVEIGCHGCSVAMVTNQKSHFHEIDSFWGHIFLIIRDRKTTDTPN